MFGRRMNNERVNEHRQPLKFPELWLKIPVFAGGAF